MRILLKNTMYMDSDFSIQSADIYIHNGIIDCIKKDISIETSNNYIMDCSDLIILPGLACISHKPLKGDSAFLENASNLPE